MKSATIDRYRVQVVNETRPCVVVLLPTLLGGSWMWSRVALELERRGLGVISIDPQYAEMGAPIPQLAAELHTLLRSIGLESAVVCGNSLGSLVALDFALAYPAFVSALVMSGAPAIGPRPRHGIVANGRITREIFHAAVGKFFHHAERFGNERTEAVWQSLSDRSVLSNVVRHLRESNSYELGPALSKLTKPVAFVWGQHDQLSPSAAWRAYAEGIPNALFEAIEDSGHCPMIECPVEFAETLLRALTRLAVLPPAAD